jgi:hypothetical protein
VRRRQSVVRDYPRIIRSGLSEAEKRAHVRAINLLRRHLTPEQQQALRDAQLKETPEKTDLEIAEMLGVDDKTITADRKRLESMSEIPRLDHRVRRNGRPYPATITRQPKAAVFAVDDKQRCATEGHAGTKQPANRRDAWR